MTKNSSELAPAVEPEKTPLAELATEINREHTAAESCLNTFMEHAIRAGNLLIEAKEQNKQGRWTAWVQQNCRFSHRTAQRYMQIVRVTAKLGPANASRGTLLSGRHILSQTVRTSSVLARRVEQGEDLPEVLDRLETVQSGTQSHVYRAISNVRHKREHANYEQTERLVISAEYPASWSHQNLNTLREQFASESSKLRAEQKQIEAEIEAIDKQLEELDRQKLDKNRKWQELQAAIPQREEEAIIAAHGHIVRGGTARVMPEDVDDLDVRIHQAGKITADEYAKIAAMEPGEERDEAVFRTMGRCLNCRVQLTTENAGVPNKPGMVYVLCHWCREHRGETHCLDCGKPLAADECMCCHDCEERDKTHCMDCGKPLAADESECCHDCQPPRYEVVEKDGEPAFVPFKDSLARQIAGEIGIDNPLIVDNWYIMQSLQTLKTAVPEVIEWARAAKQVPYEFSQRLLEAARLTTEGADLTRVRSTLGLDVVLVSSSSGEDHES